MLPLAILISGTGTNMRQIVEWCQDGSIEAQIVGVLSSKQNAPGLAWAKEQGLPTAWVNYKGRDRAQADDEVHLQLQQWGAQFVVLAGFMRIFGAAFVAQWQDRIINLHPSLLPAYKGMRTHERVLENQEKWHGSSVHVIINELDAGELIAQAKVPVEQGDDPASLDVKIKNVEHQLLPRIVQMIANGEIEIRNSAVFYRGERLHSPLMLDQLLAKETLSRVESV